MRWSKHIKTSIFEAMRNKMIIKEICDIYQKLCFIINDGAVNGYEEF